MQDESPEGSPQPTIPAAIISVSAHTGEGLESLQTALGSILPKAKSMPSQNAETQSQVFQAL